MAFHVGHIVSKWLVSPTVTILELQVPTLASFHPGQWVDFIAPPREWVGGFSLASSPSELPNLTLAVKASSSSHKPAAQWITNESSVGDNVRVRLGGGCILQTRDLVTTPAVFCAGGIGISPLLCMYRQHVQERGDNGKGASFLYLVANEEELVFVEELVELALLKNDRLVVSLTRQNEWNKPLEGVQCVTGREALHSFLSDNDAPSNAIYYLCGPPTMLDDAAYILQQKGISSERIVHEKWW